MIWFLSDLARVARERAAIDELQAQAGAWLKNVNWKITPLLEADADIEVNGDLGAEDRLQAVRRGRLSIESAEEQLGWRPQVSLRDGLSGYLEEQQRFELRVRGQAAGASHP